MGDIEMTVKVGTKLPEGSSVAVIGSGISGSSVAHFLAKSGKYRVTLFEVDNDFGGAHRTKWVRGKPYDIGVVYVHPVDYVNLFAMYTYLGMQTRSFCNGLSMEQQAWSAPKNPLKLPEVRFCSPNGPQEPYWVEPEDLRDKIARFDAIFRDPLTQLKDEYWCGSVGELLVAEKLVDTDLDDILSDPMGSLINQVLGPMMMSLDTSVGILAVFYPRVQFIKTPVWRLPSLGCVEVINRLLGSVEDKRNATKVTAIHRTNDCVELSLLPQVGESAVAYTEKFDYVVISTKILYAKQMIPEAERTELEKKAFAWFPDGPFLKEGEGYLHISTYLHDDLDAAKLPPNTPRYGYSTVFVPSDCPTPTPTSSELPNFDVTHPTEHPPPYVTDAVSVLPQTFAPGTLHDSKKWVYIDRTADIYRSRPTFNQMQGQARTFWCGVDTTDMSAEAALTSGLYVTRTMGVDPEPEFTSLAAERRLYLYTGWKEGDRDNPEWWKEVCRKY